MVGTSFKNLLIKLNQIIEYGHAVHDILLRECLVSKELICLFIFTPQGQ